MVHRPAVVALHKAHQGGRPHPRAAELESAFYQPLTPELYPHHSLTSAALVLCFSTLATHGTALEKHPGLGPSPEMDLTVWCAAGTMRSLHIPQVILICSKV